ncbi:hypothetical protein RN001_010361 [Aquatica leii]|uniref:TMEM248/TMEM219 domain-containing protein n=1 Tax=Aquatica leii TaxID=1421715 RepID=A0AAN7P0U4_9COLE|nr:hypothetical protein RN001_010361 [Aquatica leii]
MHKNFVTNVKTKPPLVVFTVCLLGIIITTVCLTYYVQTHDKISNTDAINDWISLLKYVNNLDMCSEGSGKLLQQNRLPRDSTMATISISARLLGLNTNTNTHAQGIIHLNDWYSKCPDKTYTPTYIDLQFNAGKHNESVEEEICVTITGPAQLMPILTPEQFCTPQMLKKTNWAVVSTKENTNDFCSDGSLFRIKFDTDRNFKYEMYLSKEDRIMINSHLIVTSCFLVFIVILITCYALIRKTSGAVSESKQHLTKGMYL